MGLLSLLSVVILSVYIVFLEKGPLLLLQAVQKALSRLFLLFCKDNHFF